MRSLRRRCTLLLLGAAMLCAAFPRAQDVDAEYQLKAAFVSKFPEFTEWPASALEGRSTIELCVARPNPFGSVLSELVAGEQLEGRTLVARTVDNAHAIDTCQVLFVPKLTPDARRALLARASQLPILTVGDHPGFLDEGGIVNLRLVDGRVRFEIDVAAANRIGVRLSSQLLRLAFNVRGGPA